MKITGLRVDGFGVLNGLEVDGLSEGLHVFHGSNEAGKTTLMQFVRAMLYGFSGERRRYLPPVRGGRPGGELRLLSSEGRLELARHDNVEEPARGDLVSVMYPDGTRQSEHVLKTILSGIDENVFNHVFCLGLRELQELGTLSDTEAARMLFHLSTGLGAVSLADVVNTLADARNQVLDVEGRPCQVSRLLEQRNRLRAEVEEISRVSRDYGRLAAEQARSNREIDRLEKETARLRHELRVAEIATAVHGRWQDRLSADRQLAAIGPTDSIPQGAIHRLETIDAKLDHRREYLAAWKERWSKLRREAAGLKLNETLKRLEPRIEALREQEPWLKTLEERKAELELEIDESQSQLAAERRQLGLRDDIGGHMPSLSPSTLQVLRRPARAMKQARLDAEQAQRALAETEEKAVALLEQIESRLAGSGVDDLSLALRQQGDLVAKLRRRAKIDEQLKQMHDHRTELEDQGHRLIDNQVMPIWVMAAVGLALFSGTAMLATLCFYTTSGFSTWGWPLALFLVVGALGARITKRLWERTAARRLKECRRQVSMLMSQVEEKFREREKLDRELPKSDAPARERLEDAKSQMAELEGFVSRDAQRLTAQDEAESSASRLEECRRAMAQAKKRWQAALASVGLPEDIAPKQIRSLMSRNEEMVDVGRRLEHRREELQQRNRELDALKRRIADVLSEAMLSAAPSDPVQGLRLLATALAEQRTKQKRLDELRTHARKLRHKRKRLDKSVRQLKTHRRRLFRAVGTVDEAEFRRRAAHFAEIDSLHTGRGAIQREIEAAIGGYCEEDVVNQALEGQTRETLQHRADERRRDLTSVEKRLQERCEQRGRLAEQLRVLSDNRAPAAKQLEMNMIEQQLADALHRWRVRAVAQHTLNEIRQNYQRDRQPETLREASDYLERLTQGRYTRVWTPLDENVLLVDDQHGNPRSVDVLSRGTREQLFICLRLALAAGFSRRGIVLPLVLDDVLVNFDVDRAKAAAEVMRDFAAAGHQVLVFTCHEHIQKIFKTLKVPVDTLPSHFEPATLIATKPKKERRPATKAPKPAPEPVPEPAPIAEQPAVKKEPPKPKKAKPRDMIELGEEDEIVRFQDFDDEEHLDQGDFEEEAEEVWEEIVDEESEEDPDDEWEEEEAEYEEDDESDATDEEKQEDNSDTSRPRRRGSDDWDDRYEDEYDELTEENETDADTEDQADDEYEYEYEEDEYDDEAEAA